jgi:hypothetical protein
MVDSKEVQNRLLQWGASCRRESERLGLPVISQIQVMIEHVQLEDRLRRGVRKTRRQDRRQADRTANGKQSKASRKPGPMINSAVMEVDHIVANIPTEWMKAVLIHAYLYGRSDRTCCRDLRLSKAAYRTWREAAEEYVGERLANPIINARIAVTPS